MGRVLILGGGFGGVATAISLRKLLPQNDEIIIVDQKPYFMVGFRKTWAMLDIAPLEEGQRKLKDLERLGIKVIQATVDAIKPESRTAIVDGQAMQADALVVALGIRHATEKIPGFSEHVLNAYTVKDLTHVTDTLRNFKGGRVVVGIFGTPYQCPPAPFEIAFLTKEFFVQHNIDVEMEIFTPKPMALPGAGPVHSETVHNRLASAGIEFLPKRKAVAVEQGEIIFENERRPFDLALGVPPHVVVDVIRQSKLIAEDGWVSVNRNTLETAYDGVYAIGDCLKIPLPGGGQLPKAGLMAEQEGQIVAQRIVSRFAGEKPTAIFDGKGSCNIEMGNDEAALIEGEFYAESTPKSTMSDISRQRLMDKRAFESVRLKEWFGS